MMKAAMLLALALPVMAQQDHAVSLTIRFAEGRASFRTGEAIPLDLTFRATAAGAYDLNTRSYDRSGRLGLEQPHVAPAGRDPLKNYYSEGGFLGGGLGGSLTMTTEPHTMREDLNEWVALDRPGHYSVYLTSSRVAPHAGPNREPLELTSNTLEFDVLPAGSAWEASAVASAAAILDDPSRTSEEQLAALRTLRFLNSAAAVPELVRQLSRQPDARRWQATAGLAGSPHQSLVVETLQQKMSDPDTAISAEYIFILSKLKFQLEHPLPAPYPEHDPQRQAAWRANAQARQQQLSAVVDALYEHTAELVAAKRGAARAATVRTLLMRPARGAADIQPVSGAVAAEVAAAFQALPADQQATLLVSFWHRIKVPAMVGPLEAIVEQPELKHAGLRNTALQRLHQLAPDSAARLILAEIRHPHIDQGSPINIDTLGLLPQETLPQFDDLLAARLERQDSNTKDLDAQLIGRYATASIAPRVKAVYEAAHGGWDCMIQDGLLLYFLRVDTDYGVSHMANAPSGCLNHALPAAVRMRRWQDLEPAAIGQLNGPDLNYARQAAETLARYGGDTARKAMWQRLESFHHKWAGREPDLEYRPNMPAAASDAMSFQFGLVEALGKAEGWVLSNDELTRLEALTLGPERQNIKTWRWNSPVPLTLRLLFDERLQAEINHQFFLNDLASLRRKLSQYPDGTIFELDTFGAPDQLAPVLRAIGEVAAEHGLTIQP